MRNLFFALSLFIFCFYSNTSFAQAKRPTKLEIAPMMLPTEDSALINFYVTDTKKVPEQGAKIKLLEINTKTVEEGITDIDGKWQKLVPKGASYMLVVEKFGKKFPFTDPIEIPTDEGNIELDQPLEIAVVTKYVRSYTLENMFFETNKADIKPESEVTLKKLLEAMQKNLKLKIEIAGHTDDVGNEKANLTLSQLRANAVKKYLIDGGISETRLIAKGYGETLPVVANDTPENRAKNRRTEIKIIEE